MEFLLGGRVHKKYENMGKITKFCRGVGGTKFVKTQKTPM